MNLSDAAFALMFAQTLKGSKKVTQEISIVEEETVETSFVFILNRRLGGAKAHFLSLHPHKGYVLPHMQHVTWPKLKGWIDHTSIVFNNILFVMGGKERESGKCTSRVMKYSPEDDKWTQVSSLRRPKAYFSVNVMDKHIVITGGEASDGEILESIEHYDPVTDTWVWEGKLPEPRKHHATTLVKDRLYIYGGQGTSSQFNYNLWELKREIRRYGEKETIFHTWFNQWSQCFSRKLQQGILFSGNGKLYCLGGLVQGPTEDGLKLTDEQDIDDRDTDDEAEEERVRVKNSEPYVPTYMRMLMETSKEKRRAPKNITRTTRKVLSVDVSNEHLRLKNPYKAVSTEKRMIQARAGAATITIGNRVYLFGGYRLEDEGVYIPKVEYYHLKKKRWYPAFDLTTYDNESFRDIQVHLINIPSSNPNFKLLTTAYKYPLW